MKVEAIKTPVTPQQVYGALLRAWEVLFKETPRRASVLVLLAQWAFETGHGRSMRCFNLGNAKSNQKDGDWCFYACWEVINGEKKWFYPDHAACCFRAFPNLDAGAVDYLRMLHERFTRAWPEVLAGSPDAFVRALKSQRYFTGDVDKYAAAVVSLVRQFDASLEHDEGAALPVLRRGDKGLPVMVVQALLNGGAVEQLEVDGDFGAKTEAAVKSIAPSGVVDQVGWKLIVERAST